MCQNLLLNLLSLCLFLTGNSLLCRRLFTRFRYDLLTIFQCQGSRVGYRLRNTIVRFLIRDIRTKTTFQDFHLRIFLKLLDKPLFVFFPFTIDQGDCFLSRDRKRIQIFRNRNEFTIMTDKRPETAAAATITLPSYSPTVRGRSKSFKASSNVIVSMDRPFIREAN